MSAAFQIFTLPSQQALDTAANVLSGATLTFQLTGTSTPTNAFSNSALTIAVANPLAANAAGVFIPVFLDPTVIYRVVLKTAAGAVLQTWDPANENVLNQALIGLLLNPRTLAEIVALVTPVNYAYAPTPYYDMQRAGVLPNGVDNSAIVQKVYAMAQVSGGTLIFPPGGNYSFYLNISSIAPSLSKQIVIDAQGSIFRPVAGSAQSAICYADDTAYGWNDTRLTVRNAQFTGIYYSGGSATGDVDYCVQMLRSTARFEHCYFITAKIAAFYGLYVQYAEFLSCRFLSCMFNASSVGCYIDSNGAGQSSNEILFLRCWFGSSKNGLWIRGGAQNRILYPTVMGCSGGTLLTTGGGIILDTDATGFGAEGTIVDGGWFEGNDVPHIHGGTCPNTRVMRAIFAPSGHPSAITFANTYNVTFEDNEQYGGACTATFNHGGGDDATLTWRGNNFSPVVSFTTTGKKIVDVQSAGTRTLRNDNVLRTTGQTGLNSIPLIQGEQHGFKSAVARTVATNLFSITTESFATSYEPICVLEVQLYAWQDNAASGDYGYCSRVERFYVVICNNTATLQVVGPTSIDSADISISSAFRAIGAITLSTAIASNVVTFKGTYTGTGSNAAGITTVTMAYTVRSMGSNPFTLQRL